MPSENEIILAFLYKRSGKQKLSFSDLYLTLSIDLKWFTPEDAKAFINLALKQKLLEKNGELINPNFEYAKIVVPVGFSPSEKIIEKKEIENYDKEDEEDILNKIVKRIVEKTDLNKETIIEKIEEIGKEKNIDIEVAALLIGKEYDITLQDIFENIERNIFKREHI
jgi:hypothetical protein